SPRCPLSRNALRSVSPGTNELQVMTNCLSAAFGFSLLALAAQTAFPLDGFAEDLAISHFGGKDYGDWKATGTAFQKGPASGDLLTKLEIENASDRAVASSEIEGDRPTGTLTSREFQVARKYIAFRIGGGDYEHHTCLNLLINGKVMRGATGWRSD